MNANKDTILKNNRIVWMDVLKILCAYMIVIIHVCGDLFNNNFAEANSSYYKGLIINSVVRYAVPCFFMISGTLMLSKERDFKYCIKKAIGLICAMFFWSIVYLLFRKIVWSNDINIVYEILTIPFEGKAGHLWYIYQLSWIYVILPVLYKLYTNLTEQLKILFLTVILVIPSVMDYVCRMFTELWVDVITSWNIFLSLPYIGLIFLGRFLYDKINQQNQSKKKKISIVSVIVVIVSLGVLIISTVVLSENKGGATHDLFGELRFPTLVFGIAVFCFVNSISDFFDKIPNSIKRILGKISDSLLQVYLGHILLQWILSSYLKYDSLKRIVFYSLIVYIICILCSYIYNTIKKRLRAIKI